MKYCSYSGSILESCTLCTSSRSSSLPLLIYHENSILLFSAVRTACRFSMLLFNPFTFEWPTFAYRNWKNCSTRRIIFTYEIEYKLTQPAIRVQCSSIFDIHHRFVRFEYCIIAFIDSFGKRNYCETFRNAQSSIEKRLFLLVEIPCSHFETRKLKRFNELPYHNDRASGLEYGASFWPRTKEGLTWPYSTSLNCQIFFSR